MKTFLIKLKIKKITVLMYHLQTNDIIKHEYILIKQTLLEFCKN